MITKIAKDYEARKQTALGGVSALLGKGLVSGAIHSGDITGRQTLYHGTSAKSAKKILKEGIRPTTDKSSVITKILKSVPDKKVYEEALGKSYMTPSAFEAKVYSTGKTQANLGEILGSTGKVIKGNVPLWKMNTVKNPEIAMGWDKWYATQEKLIKAHNPILKGVPLDLATRVQLKANFKQLERQKAVKGTISAKYLKGSSSYERVKLKEIGQFMKANKVRALKGVGSAAAGVGLIGLGAKKLYTQGKKKWGS